MLSNFAQSLISSQPSCLAVSALISLGFITKPSSRKVTRVWRTWRLKLPWLQRLNRMWLTPITEKSSPDFRLSLTLLSIAVLILLASCATQKPVAVSCPKVQIDPQLLQPANREAQTRLQTYLEQQQQSALSTKPAKTH